MMYTQWVPLDSHSKGGKGFTVLLRLSYRTWITENHQTVLACFVMTLSRVILQNDDVRSRGKHAQAQLGSDRHVHNRVSAW